MPVTIGTISALNATVSIVTESPSVVAGAVGIKVYGTWSQTLVFEASMDGVNWDQVAAYPLLGAGILGGRVLSTQANGVFAVMVHGYSQVRVRCSAFTSGTANIAMDVSAAAAAGSVYAITEGQKPTYSVTALAIATASGASDVFTLTGSSSKTIRVTLVTVSGTINTAAQYVDINLVKRETADSGGTPGPAPTIMQHDVNDPAPTATVVVYTANPTLGATAGGGGIADAVRYFAALTGTPAALSAPASFSFGNRPARCVVLRGTNEQLCVNLNAPANAGVFSIKMEFTEE